jgi:hypothetical protein
MLLLQVLIIGRDVEGGYRLFAVANYRTVNQQRPSLPLRIPWSQDRFVETETSVAYLGS